MAGSLNRAQLIGHVGADPEVKRTPSGVPVATFSLATSESWRDRNSGERKERTEWHRIVVWGIDSDNQGLAGIVENYVRKGSKLFIEGQLRTRSWEKQDGSKGYSTEVTLSGFGAQLLLLDRAERPSAPDQPPEGHGDRGRFSPEDYRNKNAPAPRSPSKPLSEEMDDEIPF